jgi:hypothetical protein
MEPISPKILDDTLVYKHHNEFTHMGCVLIRSTMGLVLMSKKISDETVRAIMIVMIATLIIFTIKYIRLVLIKKRVLWKHYPRFILAYSVALYLLLTGRRESAGTLILVDALMGLQSRHTAAVVSHICTNQ